jgi:hypothetical protein
MLSSFCDDYAHDVNAPCGDIPQKDGREVGPIPGKLDMLGLPDALTVVLD